MMSKSSTGRVVSTPSKKQEPISTTKSLLRVTQIHKKVVAPLGNQKHNTVFSSIYSKGGIPCRFHSGSVKHKLQWIKSPELLDYNPLFVTFVEGLRESQHPFRFIVEKGLEDLIDAEGSAEKILVLMDNIVGPLRHALSNNVKDLFLTSLKIFEKLVVLLGVGIEPYLATILPRIAAKVLAPDAEIREAVHDTLTQVQLNGGEKTLGIIRKRVPTCNSLVDLTWIDSPIM